MEWMSPMDASFLHIEGPMNPMHIGGVSIFEGPAPAFGRLEEMVAGKLGLVPRYRQKVRFVPLGLGRPVWVDDPHFQLSYHLRHSALPAPGDDAQLRRTAARIFAQHLDRNKPLWEIWMLEGLDQNRWALLSKVHHCMVDGISATDMMAVMFETGTEAPVEDDWTPEPEPGDAELLAQTLRHRTLDPSEGIRTMRAAARAPRATLGQARDLLSGMSSSVGLIKPLGESSLVGPVGPHRSWSWAQVRLSDVKQVRAALGGTVNDVVLTIVSGGIRELLEHGASPFTTARSALSCRCRSARRASAASTTTVSRRCSPSCPSGSPTRPRASSRVRAQMDGLKQSKQAVAGDVLTSLSGFAPPMLLALGARLAAASPSLGLQTGRHQRAGPAAAPVHAREAASRVVPVRAGDRARADLDRDLLLRRRALLRRHRGLRQLARHRDPDGRRRASMTDCSP